MSSSQTDLVALFLELADLSAEAQAAALAAIEDVTLRAEVAGLLEADVEVDTRLRQLDRLVPSDARAMPDAIGRYRILEEIGRGGMGVVYRARDERLGRDVAVKRLPRSLSASSEARARLEAEARAASTLDHVNICTVHALEETDDGELALVLAFYEGETLNQRLERGPLSAEEAADVLRQTADGLAAAHRAGIVHRDVKPSNIHIGADGVVRVLDFGIARGAESDLTATGATLGTAAYMAPEQTRGERADARADVWALGVVLHEMLTGERPFRGRGDALIHAIRHDAPPKLPEETSEALRRVHDRALAKDPAERFANADALRSALSHPVPSPTQPSPARWGRVLTGGFVGLATLLAVWWALRAEPVPDDTFVIAVAPFAAVGEGADADAEIMPVLIRRELDAVLAGEPGVQVIETDGEPPRKAVDAVALGTGVGAHLVVWGEAVALRGEVEIRPALVRATPYEALGEVTATGTAALITGLSGDGQIALRRTKAAEVGDLALHVAAHYHVGRGDLDRARSLLDRVREPTAETFAQRGWIAMMGEDYVSSADLYRQALDRDSTVAMFWVGRGLGLIELGRPVEAERAFRNGLEVAPNDATLLSMLAWALGFQGQVEEMLAVAQAATRSDPSSQISRLASGWGHFMAGNPEASITAFQALIDRASSNQPAAMGHYGIAIVEQSRGRLDAAERSVEQALRFVPSGIDYLALQGELALVRDDLETAERAYARLVDLENAIDYALTAPLTLAYVRARLGRPDVDQIRAIADTAASGGYLIPVYRLVLNEATEAEVIEAATRTVPHLGRDWRYEAHIYLGLVYEAGIGNVPIDVERARVHYREALQAFRFSDQISYAEYALRRLGSESPS